MEEMRNAYKSSVLKPERKISHERPRRRWEEYIEMDSRVTECEGVNLVKLTEGCGQSWIL
jgi:hypothetical protein